MSFFDWQRGRAPDAPLPDEWRAVIDQRVPLAARLGAPERARLETLVMRFLSRVDFDSPKRVGLNEVHKVTIAAQACLLLVGLDEVDEPYPDLETVVVYPRPFVSTISESNPDGTVTEKRVVRSGESWGRGTVVLSWEDVEEGTRDPDDGDNVVLHEFSHQLDSEDGAEDGAPLLKPAQYGPWARVLGADYEALLSDVHRGRRTFLGDYAATNPAEFFAVATERFFERPRKMKREHPELYAQLASFYGQTP